MEMEELKNRKPGRLSNFIIESDIRYNADVDKTKEQLDDGITAQTALNILTRYFLGEDFYITDPVDQAKANVILVEEILKRHSVRYNSELLKEKRVLSYADKLTLKLKKRMKKEGF